MPGKRSNKGSRALAELDVPEPRVDDRVSGVGLNSIENIESLLDDENAYQSTTKSTDTTASLHGELDSFRRKWKRELETKKTDSGDASERSRRPPLVLEYNNRSILASIQPQETSNEIKAKSNHAILKESFTALNKPSNDPQELYGLAKKLFLIGVDLERDELHNESIRYYKQAMHLCPNIERQLFCEQMEASIQISRMGASSKQDENEESNTDGSSVDRLPLLDRIELSLKESLGRGRYSHCKPANNAKTKILHISQLPFDLLLKIFHHVVGPELDLSSLEQLGMVCRGFYLISRNQTLWRYICHCTWGADSFDEDVNVHSQVINWRQIFMDKPRVNCDGVYISRTKYIRQGDVGFQDITYRPFHMIRYYRYMRFFPNKKVLILTTNEEPERIIPIFRHAFTSKHFSPEFSVLEGSYEFIEPNQVIIKAEKDFADEPDKVQSHNSRHMESRRQARFLWSRQTPLHQRFFMKFELGTNDTRPYRNNVLKWCEYTISAKFETGTEVTEFDLGQDTFPSLVYSRVRRLNLRPVEPINSY